MPGMRRHLPHAALLLVTTVSGCQCIDPETFGVIPDSGVEKPPVSPDPPKFALKAGDVVVVSGIGGRFGDACGAPEGGCERTLRAFERSAPGVLRRFRPSGSGAQMVRERELLPACG